MRRRLPLILLLAACGVDVAPSTTEPILPSKPATSVAESTTTTDVAGPIDICPSGKVWHDLEQTYEARCFLTAVSFEPSESGWASTGAGDDWAVVRWSDPDDLAFVTWVGLHWSSHSAI